MRFLALIAALFMSACSVDEACELPGAGPEYIRLELDYSTCTPHFTEAVTEEAWRFDYPEGCGFFTSYESALLDDGCTMTLGEYDALDETGVYYVYITIDINRCPDGYRCSAAFVYGGL